MAYDVNKFINAITNYKKQWKDATDTGDTATADKVAADAQKVYQQMYNAGYTDVADKLKSNDYSGAVKYQDDYNSNGKVSTRDYVKNALSKYGYTYNPDDFSYNEGNDNVTFKGNNLGKASYVSSDGVSYYDPSELSSKVKSIAGNLGLSTSDETAYGTNRDKMYSGYEDALNLAKNTNPFTTDIGKSIMESYGIKGQNAADDATASSAAGNSGNIDSFAAANAKKQSLAYKNAGEQAVIADNNARIANINTILSNMGVNLQNTFTNSETTKNNQVARDTSIMSATGDVLPQYSDNPYIGANMDFQAKINELSSDPEANASEINLLKEARAYKIKNSKDSAINSLSFENYTPTSKETANMRLGKAQLASNEKVSAANNSSNEKIANISAGANMYASDNSVLATQGKADATATSANAKTLAKAYDSSADAINKMYKDDAGQDVIIKNGNGNYSFNPNVDKSAYIDLIIKYMANNTAVSDDEAQDFLMNKLGISKEDVQRVASYL